MQETYRESFAVLPPRIYHLSIDNQKFHDSILKNRKIGDFEKWAELPVDLKLECIERMDFKMRCRLRSTSRFEKSIIDSQKFKFYEIRISDHYIYLKETKNSTTSRVFSFDKIRNVLKILSQFKIDNWIVSTVWLFNNPSFRKIDRTLQPKSVRIESLGGARLDPYGVVMFLKRCWTRIENLEISTSIGVVPVEKFMMIPAVIHARHLSTQLFLQPQHLMIHIKHWLDGKVDVGTRLVNVSDSFFWLKKLDEELQQESIISQSDAKRLIKTRHPKKHILILKTSGCLCCVVIPSKLKESEYSEFIKKLFF